jgi:hypothetical protein
LPAVGDPFTPSDIRELARDPNLSLASLRTGSGFSYPQRGWIYAAATAYYEHGRDSEALWARLEAELERGRGLTPFKSRQADDVRVHLETFLDLDRRAAHAPFLISAKTSPDAVTSWRNHLIRMPLGLIIQGSQGPFMRLLWAERALMHGRRAWRWWWQRHSPWPNRHMARSPVSRRGTCESAAISRSRTPLQICVRAGRGSIGC